MSPRPSSTTRELLQLYSLASPGEYNLARFLADAPDVVAQLGVTVDVSVDDVELALQLAPAIGRYKRRTRHLRAGAQEQRVAVAIQQLVATSRARGNGLELDAEVLLGDLLADTGKKYVSFQMSGARVPVLRAALTKARAPLRIFIDVAAYVDESGIHLRWRGGRGGLNFRPLVEERGAEILHVDLRSRPTTRRSRSGPVLLADVLVDLGLI